MCNPIAIGLAVQGVSTVMKGAAQARAGAAAKASNETQAEFTDRAAADAIDRGQQRALQLAFKGSVVNAEQRIAQSGSGSDVNSGANMATQQASAAINELDKRTVQRNAALEAYGLRERSRALRQGGEYAQVEGSNAQWGTFLGGAGGIVGQGGKVLADSSPKAGA